ncbi:MAG: outer membrane lipoprotein chaperone LolA [Deltaproteobacteria bacterium]|nr:outer membrane lipoprotein chaperone LolA [Deltaproteobacteria bacterium]
MFSNRLRPVVLSIVALFIASQGWALTLNDVVSKVENNYKNIVAFRGSFNQTATLKTLNKAQQAQGDIFYKKPNKVKWQYMSPTEQEIISDGKTIWMYFPENRQVYIYDLTDTFNQEVSNQGQIPGNFLTSLGNLSRDFNVQWGTPRDRDEQGNYMIELVPKRPIVNVRNIFIVVPREITTASSSTFPVLASTVYDSYGNMTNIEFVNIEVLETADETVASKKRGWTLPDSMFTYLPPANVEIIKPPLTRSK